MSLCLFVVKCRKIGGGRFSDQRHILRHLIFDTFPNFTEINVSCVYFHISISTFDTTVKLISNLFLEIYEKIINALIVLIQIIFDTKTDLFKAFIFIFFLNFHIE